jgi:light-regulated signal transduction histidine kinase (bacteriophytochrome)
VSDNGGGFALAFRRKLFEWFQRLHVDKEYEGTEIGFTLS